MQRPGSAALLTGIGLAALVAVPAVAHRFALATLRISLNYNEGWNAYHALSIVRGSALYPAVDALSVNNYPPLSFYIVAAAGQFTGDLIFAGRLVAILSFLAVTLNIGIVTATLSRSRLAGLFASTLFAAMLGAYYGRYIGINDPQMLAHALMSTALVLCVRRWESNGAIAAAMLLALAGGLVKHNLLAFPLALAIAAWAAGPRRGIAVTVGGASLAAVTVAGLQLGFGGDLLRNLLAPRPFSAYDALASARAHLVPLLLLLACVTVALMTWRRRGPELLLLSYAVLSLVLGFAFAGGAGVRENIYFDALIACSIVAVTTVARAVGEAAVGLRRQAAVLPLALSLAPMVGGLPLLAEFKWRWLDGEARTVAADTRTDIRTVRAANGTALCESLALCYWAGQPDAVDLFNAEQSFRMARLDRAVLADRIRTGAFGVIQLDAGSRADSERWDATLQEALDSAYRASHTSANGIFFVPN